MIINKKTLAGKLFILLIPSIAYVLVSLAGSELWSNILSTVCALLAAGILLYAYWSDRSHKGAIVFLFFAFACLSWAIADSIWLIMALNGQNPMANPVVWDIYLLTNCFLLVPFIISAAMQFSKWNAIQLAADIITIMIASAMMLWIVFFHKDISLVIRLVELDFTSALSLVTDILILSGMLLWLLAVRSVKLPGFFKAMLAGTGLFALADMIYYYLVMHNFYISNSLIDIVYILALDIIAFGALFKVYDGSTMDIAAQRNIGRRKKWIALIFFPILIVLLRIFHVINIKLDPIDFVQYAVLFALYATFSGYVQLSIEKEVLMKQQNDEMENRISDQIRELNFLANQDTLTSLYNRRYFVNCIDETIDSLLPNETMALMLFDLDRFKTINDRFGHDVGDKVLIELSRRLTECNNCGAVISRIGGDEFAVLVIGRNTRKQIEDICERIIGVCSAPISVGNELLEVTVSLGIALYSPEANERRTLFKNADIAMYGAKSQGYNKYLFYDPLLAENINKKHDIEVLLKQAEIEKDFQLFYQPQYSLPELKLVGAEALIRWKNAKHGYIPPDLFIPVAEEIDYIFKLGRWVVQETIRQAAEWNEHYRGDLKIGFNISPKQLKDETFINLFEAQISETKINTAWLDAEITESVMIDSENTVPDVFEAIRKLGVTVSIDDFGSGYSSLGYLNKHIFDRIKIDRSLISAISSDNPGGINVVKAAIAMAKAVDIITIAEGVETQEQLDILTELGCDQAQGYLLGRPVPAPVFVQKFIMENHKSTEK